MKGFLLFAFLFISFIRAGAQEVYVLSDPEIQRISKHFVYFEDDKNEEDIGKVLSNGTFNSAALDVPNFNVTKATVWCKLQLTVRERADWYLSLDPSSYNKVTLYQRKNNSDWQSTIVGNTVENDQRKVKSGHFLFKLDAEPGDTLAILLKIRDHFPLSVDAKVGSLESVIGFYNKTDMYNALCFGVMLMMLIYNLYLFISNKTVTYLYYVLYVFFSMLFTGILSGYGYYLPSIILKSCYRVPIVPPAGFGIFGMLFTLRFFKEALSPTFKKVIYVFISIAVLNILLSATDMKHLAFNIIQPLGLLLGILSVTAAIIALRRNHSSAKYYLIGFGAYMLSLFYIILSSLGIFPINTFTFCSLITGSVIECIMLSFALGDKFRFAQKEKESAQMETLIQAMENERLVKEQNIILEQKVKERTIELQKQKEKIEMQKELIEEKQKEILDSIQYARHIQNALLTPERQIEKMLRRTDKPSSN